MKRSAMMDHNTVTTLRFVPAFIYSDLENLRSLGILEMDKQPEPGAIAPGSYNILFRFV